MKDKTQELTQGYQEPTDIIKNLVTAPTTPAASLSPDKKWLLLMKQPSLPGIEEVAKKELRLAGLRIDPKTNGQSRAGYYTNLIAKNIFTQEEFQISGLPEDAHISKISWASDSKKFAFLNTKKNAIHLWQVDVDKKEASQLSDSAINSCISTTYLWLSDSKTIICKTIVKNRPEPPAENVLPTGPIIKDNQGKAAQIRTYQDLLQNPTEEALFEYYATSQLLLIDTANKTESNFGSAGIIKGMTTSPDGNFVLLLTIKKPFSYIVPYDRFPFLVEIYNRQGMLEKEVAKVPLAESIPIGFGGVRTGKRSFMWRGDVPASLHWVEAQDDGDPKKEAEIRDIMYAWKAPFSEVPKACLTFQLRYGGVEWGNENLAIAYEWQWQNRQILTSKWAPAKPELGKQLIFDKYWEDRYADPGDFVSTRNKYGRSSLLTDASNQHIYLMGQGASAEGNRPFVDRFNLSDNSTERLWRSEAPYYEYPIAFVDDKNTVVLSRREAKKEPPNFYLRDFNTGTLKEVTNFEHPYPSIKNIQKEIIKYRRKDGVELSGTLYLPEGYKPHEDAPLPALLWAYPKEFKTADAASQMKDSPYEFIRIGWWSPIFWVQLGYAVLDDFGMPVIGEGDEEPNETFVEQIVSGAEAAIDYLAKRGVADPEKIAVGGHSYGAFMTANLLAHTNLFAAGIARSGAYNRSLTPFGFQSEERTFWEAPETYMKMSPFTYADKIKSPLLLIHGEADNNAGTYPMQSERLFSALQGQGAAVRLVMLPHESHSYQAKESILHMLWEMSTWLEEHVMNKKVAATLNQ